MIIPNNSTLAAYLNDVSKIAYAVEPSNGNKKSFKREREDRNRDYGEIIRRYYLVEERLLKEAKDLQKKIKKGEYSGKKLEKNKERLQILSKRVKRVQKIPEYVDAKQRVAETCLLLGVNLAKYYARKHERAEICDFIQDSSLGLMRGARKFDPKISLFSTYSTWWMRQSIRRNLDEETGIQLRLSAGARNLRGRVEKITNRLYSELEREPKPEEVAEKYNQIYKPECPLKRRIVVALMNSENIIGLNSPGDDKYIDIKDNGAENPAEKLIQKSDYQMVMEWAKQNLNSNEQTIILARFGINDGTPKTLEEIGKTLGLTRERIRQIEKRALRKLQEHFQRKTDNY